MKDKVLKLIVKYFNLKGLMTDLVVIVLKDVLEKVVKDTENTIDDTIFPVIWPSAEKEAVKFIDENLDLEKLLGLSTDEPEIV
jgi:hypothetical protein